jgi:hypothetical protein
MLFLKVGRSTAFLLEGGKDKVCMIADKSGVVARIERN